MKFLDVNRARIFAFPRIQFPFQSPPEIVCAETTVLRLDDGNIYHTWQWIYLVRECSKTHVVNWKLSQKSFSSRRAVGFAKFLGNLSSYYFRLNARARTIKAALTGFNTLMIWADGAQGKGKYEGLFDDAQTALDALIAYDSHTKSLVRGGKISRNTGGNYLQAVTAILSAGHNRNFSDHLDRLRTSQAAIKRTQVPSDAVMHQYLAVVAALYDVAAARLLRPATAIGDTFASTALEEGSATVVLNKDVPHLALIELCCLCFAALAISDSGANLGPFSDIQYDADLLDQTSQPAISTITRRSIKFRARGKLVNHDFSTATVRRLAKYLQIREMLLASTDSSDSGGALFLRLGDYGSSAVPLNKSLLLVLSRRVHSLARLALPKLALRQLRAFKQHHVIKASGPQIAAELLGHTVETAIRVYSNGRMSDRASEMGGFLDSLESTAVAASRRPHETELPAGNCTQIDQPRQLMPDVPVTPDCKQNEGCFFCAQYVIHADESDLRKLLSCRFVLRKIASLQGAADVAERVYGAVMARIKELLAALENKDKALYERVAAEVDGARQLTAYWDAKMRQLALLGFSS